MVTKITGYYSELPETDPGSGQLVLEIGEHDIACLVRGSDNPVEGFELFSVGSGSHSPETLLSALQTSSRLLKNTYRETVCYYNSEEAMIIPAEKFDTAAAEAYMSLVYGEKYTHDTRHDLIGNDLVNSYRVSKSMHDLLGRNFVLYKPRHSFSKLLEDLLSRGQLPSYFVKIQVYNRHMICCLMKDGKLHLLRSFQHQSSEDILYYLISLLQQFPVTKTNSTLELSGMLAPDHHLYTTLFGEIWYDDLVPEQAPAATALKTFPAYYFTPFVKLVL